MLHRILAVLAFLFAPVAALAQAAAEALPVPAAAPPASFREWIWTGLILPFVAILFRELQQWLAARRQQAQIAKDTDQRAFVEDMLFRLVDAVGAPIYSDLRELLSRVTDPTSAGGAEITGEEWKEIFEACEAELRGLLTPAKLDLVMKTIGLGAAARFIGQLLVKRLFAIRQKPDDVHAALYGVRGAPAEAPAAQTDVG